MADSLLAELDAIAESIEGNFIPLKTYGKSERSVRIGYVRFAQ
jgi:hypothetical protein